MNWVYIIIGGFLSGIAGSLGIGGGGILIIFLTIFMNVPQISAQGINLLFFIPIAIISVIIYYKKGLIKFKPTLIISAFGLIGVFIGTPVGQMLGNEILSKIFGGILILISIKELFSKDKKSDSLKESDSK